MTIVVLDLNRIENITCLTPDSVIFGHSNYFNKFNFNYTCCVKIFNYVVFI